MREPEDREQLMQLLHSAHQRKLLDADALEHHRGRAGRRRRCTCATSWCRAPQMEVIDDEDSLADDIAKVNAPRTRAFRSSRQNRDNVIGILLAKDLLRVQRDDAVLAVRDWLRPAMFIPEFKRLDVLLREFRVSRNHMAIVIDEYAGVAGLITIEDVLEQIVGDIEDEYDFDEADDNIQLDQNGLYRVKAHRRNGGLQRRLRHAFQRRGIPPSAA
jgi:magnesium and cobalt transporter